MQPWLTPTACFQAKKNIFSLPIAISWTSSKTRSCPWNKSDVFQAMYQRQQDDFSWTTIVWTVAQLNEYWIGHDALPLPSALQINCGGLGPRP